MLTAQQSKLLKHLYVTMSNGGLCPSYEEMSLHMGLSSKSGIYRLVKALVERGFIQQLHHRKRAIEVVRIPSSLFCEWGMKTDINHLLVDFIMLQEKHVLCVEEDCLQTE